MRCLQSVMETGSTLPDPWREWVNDSLREWESQGLLVCPKLAH